MRDLIERIESIINEEKDLSLRDIGRIFDKHIGVKKGKIDEAGGVNLGKGRTTIEWAFSIGTDDIEAKRVSLDILNSLNKKYSDVKKSSVWMMKDADGYIHSRVKIKNIGEIKVKDFDIVKRGKKSKDVF